MPKLRVKAINWVKSFRRIQLTHVNHVEALLEALLSRSASLGEDIRSVTDINSLARDIVQLEEWNLRIAQSATLTVNRTGKYANGWDRLRLHANIVESLMTKVRPKNEDSISIKNGGALPCRDPKLRNHAYLVTGPPAAGKSALCAPLAIKTESVIVDPDDAKKMLPEYRNGLNANALHAESSSITKGPNGVLMCAAEVGYNIVLPTIGADQDKLDELRTDLTRLGYTKVYLLCVDCPIEIAAVRSLERMQKTGRYVPLKYLLAEVGDKPVRVFKRLKRRIGWAGFGLFSTRERGVGPKIIQNDRLNFTL